MSSLKPHKRTATRTRVGAATAAMAVVMGLTPATAVAAPVNPLAELGNRLDSVSDLPANVAAPDGIKLPGGGFEVPDSISLPSSSGENTDPNAPKPTSYRPDQIARAYPSDAATDNWFYFYVVHPFVELEKNHPEVMDQNLETVVRINNAAKNDPQAQELALDDDYLDPLANISTAFGANLGQHFRDAYDEDRLPKVKALLSGNLARGGGLVSSTFFEKYVYGYDRPFVVAPERIERYYREGQDDPYSTTPSYPSGHTNKAAWTSTMLAMMLPEVAPQIQARASEAGHSRLVMGVHYPLDVMGGRMMGNQAAADRWADPEFRPLIEEAMDELRTELEYRCSDTIANCVAKDTPYMSTAAAVQQYTERMTYDFKQVGPANEPVVVPKRYAGLLETRFPQLTEEQRSSVLAQTAIPSGYPLDRTDGEGQHVRMNLARALASNVVVNADGSVTVTN
ncbi:MULTISPECIES: acid phosphatase [Corynebacterium]|mgnify:CR=1 FL=1|uniref:acid phosphatase n=1 Tax=Corynebacterium TaxID=1716 RepID=UPI0008A61617|nr:MULTISPECIES: phosphatase PAP2 family protein [Corynebacterium]MBC6821165.1 phosphatase PAP2 family protein [Corynebacterium sp. LK33]KAA9225060.1 phosphatase PAP2 family protein [Corynebacterium amycolatum]MDK6442839.1 phosphatase PAP2 family protein [Corynebacterium amycolatum]OFR60263.1 acid phosphatase [Corynebacterium sp. HMSC065H09]OHQ64709.1 acid phosphatase [Corynebacterium sp. HMSC072B08]